LRRGEKEAYRPESSGDPCFCFRFMRRLVMNMVCCICEPSTFFVRAWFSSIF